MIYFKSTIDFLQYKIIEVVLVSVGNLRNLLNHNLVLLGESLECYKQRTYESIGVEMQFKG